MFKSVQFKMYLTLIIIADGFKTTGERKQQLIEQSKYLGGDLALTHLVKGLDYALLQKVIYIRII